MAALDHWHPIFSSKKLRHRPVSVCLADQEIVLFRGADGKVGALEDLCPHRGMRLSRGAVAQGRLVCPYHGWSYDTEGQGQSPATPQVQACATAFETQEYQGAIWIRRTGSTAPRPELEWPEFRFVATRFHSIEAPLEVVLDNFTEVEHTPSTHALLGYDGAAMSAIECRIELADTSVRVINTGPQKALPWLIQHLFGVYNGDCFTDDWTTYFSPVYSIYDHWWADPKTEEPRPRRLRSVVFFNPVNAQRTDLTVFAFVSDFPGDPLRLIRPLADWILTKILEHEVKLDQRMIEALADKDPSLNGRRLGRFDKALRENRKRIARIYHGAMEPKTEAQSGR